MFFVIRKTENPREINLGNLFSTYFVYYVYLQNVILKYLLKLSGNLRTAFSFSNYYYYTIFQWYQH